MPTFVQNWRSSGHVPRYLIGSKVRVSTVGLIIAFAALFWVYENYQVPVGAPEAPATQVVPPGFVPDPDYTWVPRTNVRTRTAETTTPTTTETTSTTTTPSQPATSPGETTSTTETGGPTPSSPTTTVIDPDGSGPSGPQTFTESPPATSAPSGPAGAPPPVTPPTR